MHPLQTCESQELPLATSITLSISGLEFTVIWTKDGLVFCTIAGGWGVSN